MKQIASPDNPTFRQALRLHQSARERRKLGRTLLDGVHLVQEYLATDHRPEQLLVTASGLANAEIAALVQSVGEMHSALLADDLFAQVTSLDSPSGVVAVIDTPEEGPLPLDAPACLMLDDVQDPGNVGSILRSASAAGVRHVALSRGCAFAWAPRVVRAAMGAHFRLHIHENQDLNDLVQRFAGTTVAACVQDAAPLYDVPLGGQVAILIGNEGAGLAPELVAAAHSRACIPMASGVESINAAAAAAVFLFERLRQQRAALRSGT